MIEEEEEEEEEARTEAARRDAAVGERFFSLFFIYFDLTQAQEETIRVRYSYMIISRQS